MIKSMTGFGSAKGMCGNIEISIELKSVNNRYLDCSVKIPRGYLSLEKQLKSIVQERVSRGKVDVFVSIDLSGSDELNIKINHNLASEYISALRELIGKYDLLEHINVADVMRFNDIIIVEKEEADIDVLGKRVCEILCEAFIPFEQMRIAEGMKLKEDILMRLNEVAKFTEEIEKLSPVSHEAYKSKLHARIQEILGSSDIEEARVLTEVAIFADRTAINEETTRLRSHISQLRQMLSHHEPVGRKIDFLVQEFNREVNTIASKGSDVEISKLIVDFKAEIEKIREQAQNIE